MQPALFHHALRTNIARDGGTLNFTLAPRRSDGLISIASTSQLRPDPTLTL
jgi:hypothetical protein